MVGSLISFREAEVEYPGVGRVLGPISLDVERGGFVSLVGPSGSGKTTFLNLVGGLDQPTSGTVEVDGQRLDQLDDRGLSEYRSRRVGFVFQSFQLHPARTAVQNLLVPLYFTDLPLPQGRSRARQLLARLGLEGLEDRPVGRLSGGQRQRVAMARALMNSPILLLADEPIGNLDQASAQVVLELMVELNEREGVTILTATHDPLLLEHSSQVIRMEAGAVLA